MNDHNKSVSDLSAASRYSQRTIRNALSAKAISKDVIKAISTSLGIKPSELHNEKRINLGNLPRPSTPELFVGRKSQLEMIRQAWLSSHGNAVQIIGDGGTGKSATVWNWLKTFKRNFEGVQQAFDWSFYSQGQHEYVTDSHQFIDAAIEHFSAYGLYLTELDRSNPVRLGAKIASRLTSVGGILILDGLEPLQNPPNVNGGRIRDSAVQQLVRGFQNQAQIDSQQALLLITSRWGIPEIDAKYTIQLEGLKPKDGATLLKKFRVQGNPVQLTYRAASQSTSSAFEEASREFGGHPLALTLLASLIITKFNGDLATKVLVSELVPNDNQTPYRHARRVMLGYDKFMFPPESDSTQSNQCRQLLGIVSLFDRSVSETEMLPISEAKIPGVSDSFANSCLKPATQTLCNLGIITVFLGVYYVHPLVREHFRNWFQEQFPDGVQKAHEIAFRQLSRASTDLPSTTQEISPLYMAVFHGCKAGLFREAFEIYENRVYQDGLTWRKLGLISADLSALANFCPTPWKPAKELEPKDQGFVLVLGGFLLRCLGRLKDATLPLAGAREVHEVDLEDFKEAANDMDNLAQCFLSLGELEQCRALSTSSIAMADKSTSDPSHAVKVRVVTRTVLGHAMHHFGEFEDAEKKFLEAEAIWQEEQSDCQYLCSASGFRYCSLLLRQNRFNEVLERVEQTEGWARDKNSGLAIGFDCLSKGWARLGLSDNNDLSTIKSDFERGLEAIRNVNMIEHLPLALLGMADVEMMQGQFTSARMYLDEAIETCSICDLRIHLCDTYARYARCISLTGRNRPTGRKHLSAAKTMAEHLHYRAIFKTLDQLEKRLD